MLDQKFGWAEPVFDAKNGPVGPTLVNQNWSGRIDFYPGPIFSLHSYLLWGDLMIVWQWNQKYHESCFNARKQSYLVR